MEVGEGVTLCADGVEITTPQAADLLNVSPPYIGGLADKGALPARMAGNQRRALWLHRGCSQGHLAADLQRAASREAWAPAVEATSFTTSGRAS
jgi:excisionase family DNA binding protein